MIFFNDLNINKLERVMKSLDDILKFFFSVFEVTKPLKSKLVNEILNDPEASEQFLKNLYNENTKKPKPITVNFNEEDITFVSSRVPVSSGVPENV